MLKIEEYLLEELIDGYLECKTIKAEDKIKTLTKLLNSNESLHKKLKSKLYNLCEENGYCPECLTYMHTYYTTEGRGEYYEIYSHEECPMCGWMQ